MNQDAWLRILFILAGLFAILAAVFNWDFYFSSRKSRMLEGLIGRTGVRIFNGVVGILLVICSIMIF